MRYSVEIRALADALATGKCGPKTAVKKLRDLAASVAMLELRAAPVDLDRIDEQIAALSCGDNSCMMARPRGMATNGGCRCVTRDSVDTVEDRSRLRNALLLRRQQVEELKRRLAEKDVP